MLCLRCSTPPLDVCTLLSAKPELLPEGSHRPIPICRIYLFALRWAAKFARPSPPNRDMSSSPPIIRRSNCGSWPTSQRIRCWSRHTVAAMTFTPLPRRRCLVCRRSWSPLTTDVNTPLQGTAADMIKMAMIRIDAAIIEGGLKSRMTLQVHDELVFEVPEEESDVMRTLVREQMENVHALTVPLLVEIGVGRNWRDQE